MRRYIQGISYPDSRRQCTSPSPAGICDQPSQILPYPIPGDDASRCLDRHPKRPGKAIPEQGSGDQPGVCPPVGKWFRVSRSSPECRRTDGCLLRHSSSVSISTHLSRNFKWRTDPIQKIIPLAVPEVLEALQFRSDPSLVAEEVPLGYQPSSQTLTMDASSYGWGAVLDGSHCSGRWTHRAEELQFHVNILELTAVIGPPFSERSTIFRRVSRPESFWFRRTTSQSCLT